MGKNGSRTQTAENKTLTTHEQRKKSDETDKVTTLQQVMLTPEGESKEGSGEPKSASLPPFKLANGDGSDRSPLRITKLTLVQQEIR